MTTPRNVKDEDLLANAISIEDLEDDEAAPAKSANRQPSEDESTTIDLVGDDESSGGVIRTFEQVKAVKSDWKRAPKQSPEGATRVKTFVAKLRLDALEYLDDQINEWLDEHPECDIKFATTSTGPLTGKMKEDAIIVNIWI